MMLVFMALFELVLCIDCWCIVGLQPTMTSVAYLGFSFVPPTSLLSPFPWAISMEDIKMEGEDNTNVNEQMSSPSSIYEGKQVEEKDLTLISLISL
jgi:hypothetical protein